VESGLSFLGLGAQPPIQLGSIIKDHWLHYTWQTYLAMVPVYGHYVIDIGFMMMGMLLRRLRCETIKELGKSIFENEMGKRLFFIGMLLMVFFSLSSCKRFLTLT
jgi:hypothetical protein